ncbi:MAG: response regulator [Polyangiaceae bacterium]|nr:response regulator [Polyangiaceae bacterium]
MSSKDEDVVLETATLADRIRDLNAEMRQLRRTDTAALATLGLLHDFNNLVTVILFTSGLLVRTLQDGSKEAGLAVDVRDAAKRTATLARQILNLARGGSIRMCSVDVNGVLDDLRGLLERMVGDDVALTAKLAPDLGFTCIDRDQLEHAIINLAANARDAMPSGGRLMIETANVDVDHDETAEGVAPGPYIVVSVSDTGFGMSARNQGRAFEPFFTTKERGQGLGLGLAMARRFASESGGYVTLTSLPSHGTTLRIHLPRTEEKRIDTPRPPPSVERSGGREKVLLVERDEGVRKAARRVLEQRGYAVVDVGSAADAIAIAERRERIDVVVTELALPVVSGRALVRILSGTYGPLPAVYLSHRGLDARALDEPSAVVVDMPLSPNGFANAVREALDATLADRDRPSPTP